MQFIIYRFIIMTHEIMQAAQFSVRVRYNVWSDTLGSFFFTEAVV